MELFDIIFYFFAIVILGSAAIVVFSKNIMYSAFALLFTFFGVAGLYVMLNADFIAITQLMVYVGGILILIIFAVMLTSKVTEVEMKTGPMSKFQIGGSLVLSLLVGILLSLMYLKADWFTAGSPVANNTIVPIGTLLLTDYLLAFELAAVLLLIAFIGAAMIARRK